VLSRNIHFTQIRYNQWLRDEASSALEAAPTIRAQEVLSLHASPCFMVRCARLIGATKLAL
jgi:hypothetical protein